MRVLLHLTHIERGSGLHDLSSVSLQPNTFQLTIIYDASSWMTFLVFGYEKTGWDSFLTVRSNTVGYYVTQYGIDKKAVPWVSGKEASFTLADLKGNTSTLM